MASLKGFWQFLNTDVKEIPWEELAANTIDVATATKDLGEAWEEQAPNIKKLQPYIKDVEPFLETLNSPVTQLAISGLPFVSVGIGLLRIYLNWTKAEPTFESSVVMVAQLAYVQSLEVVLGQVNDAAISEKLATVSLGALMERQIARLDADRLNSSELKVVTSRFRESKLAEQFSDVLTEQLKKVKLIEATRIWLVETIAWGAHRYLYQAIAEVGDSVKPLAEFYRIGGKQEQDRYVSIDTYLKHKIATLPAEQIFDESNPLITFNDIYVPLDVQPLTQSGEEKENAVSINIHDWARDLLEQTGPRKVMFVEGNAGQGKSVFCHMFAAWVCQNLAFSYIPLFIRLRSLRAIENTLTGTLENCPDLEPVEFVGKEGWLKDKNTRFLIILDGFDELLLQGRAGGGLQEFLQQISDFQERTHHQCLVTGRPLALQGVAQRITQNKNLERVKLQPMDDKRQKKWLTNWKTIFGQQEVTRFCEFLEACPTEIANNLAREPLLIYLLARLHREEQLTSEMFADAEQESQAKLRVYRESVNWVLEKQRQQQNERLSGLDDPEDLREVLQEAALCVVQSGNETAQLSMLKTRFRDSSNRVARSLKTAQKATGQPEDKTLNNLLTTFYLRPGEEDKRGSVEFAHKSFGEYLFAERLMAAFEAWTEIDRRKRDRLDEQTVHDQIYDLLGFGGLDIEIVEYVLELLDESEINRVRLFQRLHTFYKRWYDGDFLDQDSTENLPQKKFQQLKKQNISIGLRQVDIFVGLNVLTVLFRLHATAQSEDYPEVSYDKAKPEILFYPCGEPKAAQFDEFRLLKIIHYTDSLELGTFTQVVGPHLVKTNLSSANLSSANLSSANLSSANLNSTNLYKADLSSANLNSTSLSKANLSSTNLSSASLSNANLSNVNLNSANLHSANLQNANLDRVYFDSANLSKANLSRANLDRAYFDSANLSNANLSSTNLSSANLSSANLSKANLSRANISRANLSRANISKANLSSADLYRTNLSRADLSRANLSGANLVSTKLFGANLSRADLSNANLSHADLSNADLSNADLSNADLSSANLSNVDLSNADLSNADLSNADLSRVNLSTTILLNAKLHVVQNLTSQQLQGKTSPLICSTTLPPELKTYQDRDRERLPAALRERYPKEFESLEAAKKFINEHHLPSA
ncbi:MAG: pentapeptide repeat-containing protein [Cyanobacteria bacterium P01_H01_bin.26]